MASILRERILIGAVACGPTYRESAYKQLNDYYFDDDNVYYYVLTDDKGFFDSLQRKNLVVKQLEEYYSIFPEIEKHETFLKSTSAEDYATKFLETGWKFPFSTYRFILHHAIELEITNVALMCTDAFVRLDTMSTVNNFFDRKNRLYCAVSLWDEYIWNGNITEVLRRLQFEHNLIMNSTVMRVYDQAGRIIIARDLDQLKKLFEIWHDVTVHLWKHNFQRLFYGPYVVHDEYILAPIYHVLGINKDPEPPEQEGYWINCAGQLITVKHNALRERFFSVIGGNPKNAEMMKGATSYEEFLQINGLTEEDVENICGWKNFCENK